MHLLYDSDAHESFDPFWLHPGSFLEDTLEDEIEEEMLSRVEKDATLKDGTCSSATDCTHWFRKNREVPHLGADRLKRQVNRESQGVAREKPAIVEGVSFYS